jgi:hypothetical protein
VLPVINQTEPDQMLNDLRYAIRSLTRTPGFALAVILTLGLGIGANTAIFSVVRGVLLKPLPHKDGDRLVYLRQSINGPGGENILFSVPEILDFRNSAKTLQGIAEYSQMAYTLQGADDAVRISVGLVTGNYFQIMGLGPILGRALNDGDDGTGVPPVMVLTRDYWMSRFGGDSAIIGKMIRVDGRNVEVGGRRAVRTHVPESHGRDHEHGHQRAPHERDDGARPHAPHDRDDRPPRARRHGGAGPLRGHDHPAAGAVRVHGRLRPGIGVSRLRDSVPPGPG